MFRIYMVISSFFCIFISQKAGYGYGEETDGVIPTKSENRT